jgi:beta-lactamase regulating signal transducer with metallopeptidase domain
MNAVGVLSLLLRTTLFLSVAAIFMRLLLKFGRPASPWVHRMAWVLVLLPGWFWWRLPVTVPYREPIAAVHVPATVKATMTATLLEVAGVWEATRDIGILSEEPVAVAPVAANREIAAVRWPSAICGIWLAGMCVLVVIWSVSYLRFLRCLHAAGPAEEAWVRQWQELCAQRRVLAHIPLRVMESFGPLLCCTPRGHMLVVPAVLWRRLTPAERLSVLQHELAHFQRRDPLKSTLVRLLALPHWFNPLSWLAVSWFDEAAEWACDEAAKGDNAEGRREYTKALLQLDSVLQPRWSYRAAALGRGVSTRIERLLHPQGRKDSIVKKALILGAALGIVLFCLLRVEFVTGDDQPAGSGVAASADEKLIDAQRLYCQWDAGTFGLPDSARWQKLSEQEKAAKEEELLKQLVSDDEDIRVRAIDDLVVLGSKKAIPGILQIAADRKEKDNWDRHTAVRALGMLGDTSVVPELVHLTYHYNWNVRQWAQIALVRLTGQNFGHDVAAWKQWWDKQGGKPPISDEIVAWATSPRMIQMLGDSADPKNYDELDRQASARLESQGRQAGC